ncbi:MAG: serine acetyltransferase [Verrucomicrobia bacterium]|nr:serine acetyltransferase [Verrucomicrobiota bacterium]
MEMKKLLDGMLPDVFAALDKCENCPAHHNVRRRISMVGQQAVVDVLEDLIAVLFPGCHLRQDGPAGEVNGYSPIMLEKTALNLREQCRQTFEYQCTLHECDDDCGKCDAHAVEAVGALVKSLPDILGVLQQDILAAYEGDPAAKSTMEVVMSYPGVYAVIVHRIAHCLYQQKVPLIPRVMAEYAHSKTGIDIHPGATLGEGFFIDHGTGVVIGETCVIGRRVKLYQGVTLGALSFEKDAGGHLVKGIKRHPNVEDHVVVYAGATILGGNTTIGAGSVIGGNVWLTHSVPPGSKVYNQQPNPLIREADGAWRTVDGPWDDLGAGI